MNNLKNNKIRFFILNSLILLLFSCSKQKNCGLIGKWESISFTSNEAIDFNKDNLYSKNLLKEDKCAKVIYTFLSNGKVELLSKNKKSRCKFRKKTMSYTIDENKIIVYINKMKQVYPFKISNCKLIIYDVLGSGISNDGNKRISISATFKRI